MSRAIARRVVSRSLRGRNAGDIPYYQAAKFEMSINLKTATTLRLALPPTLLAIADHVIE